jgi:cytidyltransferase-like protein
MEPKVKKKVFVSGCYDMLHSGHVAFFEEAASYGDLYVGIGSDKTIKDLKARKTINTEAERLYMVKSLKAVKDAWVNSGSGLLDFEKEVRELKPDIFFVNSDGSTPLKEKFKLTKGLVDVNGNTVPHNFKDQADMCEIARALIANGVLKDVNLNDLNENSFRDLNCPGNYNEIGICAVSGGSAAQSYAWYILLEGKGIQINGYPQWELTKKSKEIIEGKRIIN